MNMKSTLAASALVLAMGLAMPAAAQQTTGPTSAGPTTGGSGANADATSTSTSTDVNVQDSGNDNSDNSLDIADSGNDNSDNSIDVADSGNDNSDNSLNVADSGNDSSNNSTNNSNNGNDSSAVVALQVLTATVSNAAALNFNGTQADYSSGSNSVSGSAFAAFSGILNNGWNTGINANAQAATNIAARGTVTFTR